MAPAPPSGARGRGGAGGLGAPPFVAMAGGGGGWGLGTGTTGAASGGGAYLDHAGACLADPGLPAALAARLAASATAGPTGWRGNPHSGGSRGGEAEEAEPPPAAGGSEGLDGEGEGHRGDSPALAKLRAETLALLHADPREYCCVLTSGATAALRLVAESFPFGQPGARLCFPLESHTSVLGLRPLAEGRGAQCDVVRVARAGSRWRLERELGGVDLPKGAPGVEPGPAPRAGRGAEVGQTGGCATATGVAHPPQLGPGLFCSSAECNFAGGRLDPALGTAVRSGAEVDGLPLSERWWWLLDAAKACGGGRPPDLAAHPADFVALSFYKIFGWPTGLGALVLRREALHLLLRYRAGFGGGAVATVLPVSGAFRRRSGVAGLEDGTPAFLEAEGALEGFQLLRRMGGAQAVEAHCAALGERLRRGLAALVLPSGEPACQLYGPPGLLRALNRGGDASSNKPMWAEGPDEEGYHGVGSGATFNLRRLGGAWVGYAEVKRACARSGFRVRTGCMCNPGACMRALGLSEADLVRNAEAGKVCGDEQDLLEGRPTGAVRASLGFYNTEEEVDAFVGFLQEVFASVQAGAGPALCEARIKRLFLYPVKSCRALEVVDPDGWPLDWRGGLLHDRRWAVVDKAGRALTQKRCPALARVQPSLEPEGRALTLHLEGPGAELPPITIDITSPAASSSIHSPDSEAGGDNIRVCARWELGRAGWMSSSADAWLELALGTPCRLIEVSVAGGAAGAAAGAGLGSFANQSPLLVLSEASLAVLNKRLADLGQETTQVDWRHFRLNVLLSGCSAFAEDARSTLSAGSGGPALRHVGPCQRCSMVALDPETGARGPVDVLREVAALRRERAGAGALPAFGSYFAASAGRTLAPGTLLCPAPPAAPGDGEGYS